MVEPISKVEAQDLKEKMEQFRREFSETAKAAKDKTTAWVKDHPGTTVGIIAGVAASVGFTVGFVVARKLTCD